MDFGTALQAAISHGARISRDGWNGAGMYVWLHKPFLDPCADYLMLRAADGTYVPWTVSQTDVLADDWVITVEVVGTFDEGDQDE